MRVAFSATLVDFCTVFLDESIGIQFFLEEFVLVEESLDVESEFLNSGVFDAFVDFLQLLAFLVVDCVVL